MISDDDFNRLRLIRSARIGPVTYRQLVRRFGGASAALDALPDLASRGGGKFTATDAKKVEQEIAETARAGGRYLFLDQTEYPALLAQLENAPPAIIWRGDLSLLERQGVAMVGARNASAGACKFARGLSYDIGQNGFTVISGLARGIDTAAHNGALKTGTIAVIAGGIDVAYPPENAALQEEIAETGLLLAEQPPGTEPKARHFPHRNRIIAGLALGTVVVEAAPKSGSLITARLAAEAGREVMAIPGSPIDPRARGCNQLIREGATLVQDAGEIVELLSPLAEEAHQVTPSSDLFAEKGAPYDADDDAREHITGLLGFSYVSVDELIRQSQAPAAMVQTVLLELELAGRLERGAGQKVRLTA